MNLKENLKKEMLGNLSEKDFSRIKKKMKESLKDINNGRRRNFYLSEYIPIEFVVEFVSIQNKYFDFKFKEEKKRANDFLYNEDKAIEYGFYSEIYEDNIRKEINELANKIDCNDHEDCSKIRRKFIKSELRKRIPEQKEEQALEWANQAYPNINEEYWNYEVEMELINLFESK